MGNAIVNGLVGFSIYVLAVLLLLRIVRRISPALVVTATSVLIYAMQLIACGLRDRPVLFWPMSASYWFLTLCFLMAFGAIYKSVSLRMLAYLLQRPGRCDQYEAILDRYVREESYRNRLCVLISGGLARQTSTGFELTKRGKRLAFAVDSVQRVFGIERSG